MRSSKYINSLRTLLTKKYTHNFDELAEKWLKEFKEDVRKELRKELAKSKQTTIREIRAEVEDYFDGASVEVELY